MSMRLFKMLAPINKTVEFYGFDDGCYACLIVTPINQRLVLAFLSKVFVVFDNWPGLEWYLADFNQTEMKIISKGTWSKQEYLDRGFTYAKIL